nr:14559_t:CDS:10 [Entrophospora candida]
MELAFLNIHDQVSVIALVLVIAFIVGVIVGPYVLNIINPESLGNVDILTKQFTRIVIAVQVMAAGVVLPKAYLRTEFRSVMILLVPVMSWMWLGTLLIASSVTPTDPVLANSIIKGKYAEKYVPANVRDAISAESDWFRKEMDGSKVQEVIDVLFNMTIFVFLGTVMPWSSYNDEYLGLSYWRLILMAIFMLLFRRLPIVMALFKIMPAIKTTQEALFTGWFGPMGVSAVFYAQVAKETFSIYNDELENPDGPNTRVRDLIVPVVYFIVFGSIFVHGISVPLKGENLDIVVINGDENPITSQQNNDTLMTLENQGQELNIINVNNNKKYAIYNDEQDNLFIEDENGGSMYVIPNNPPSEIATTITTMTTTTVAADTPQHIGDDPHSNNK